MKSIIYQTRPSLMLATVFLLAGCSVAPTYDPPFMALPAAFKEGATASAADGATHWKAAEPAEDKTRGQWWKVFNDDTLNMLEEQASAANQDLKAGMARLAQARALEKNARSALFPQLDVGFGPTRQKPSPASLGLPRSAETNAATLWRGQANFAYEVDLFGRINSAVNAANFDLQRNSALFHSLQLAIQADVAQVYFMLREFDAERELFNNTVSLREQTLKLFQRRFDEGDISELDIARAKTELASAQSELHGIERRRAIAEHALAVLLGKMPSEFSLPAQPITRIILNVPPGLPSELLERRPDIAAAERAMAAANARVGIAKSAFFPRLNLTGSLGYESAELKDLFKWSSRTFVVGPLVGTLLSLPVLDGGRRKAEVALANSVYDEEVAVYRQTVLSAFREVEDNLADLRILGDQMNRQGEAVNAALRTSQLSKIQYREGSVSYLSVIDADRSTLEQRRAAVRLEGERARATVNLIRALGGGWEAFSQKLAAANPP
jgi:multidrug efflux system outer membrane protein